MSNSTALWIAPTATIIATALTLWFTNRKEKQRQGHELRLKERDLKAELDAARITRLRDERIAAYRKLLAATLDEPTESKQVEEVSQALNEVELLAESAGLRICASAVWHNYREVYRARKNEDVGLMAHATAELRSYRGEFLERAREELGVSPSAFAEGVSELLTPTTDESSASRRSWWRRIFGEGG